MTPVSNSGPGDPTRPGFEAMINGITARFSMSPDGTEKKDLSNGAISALDDGFGPSLRMFLSPLKAGLAAVTPNVADRHSY